MTRKHTDVNTGFQVFFLTLLLILCVIVALAVRDKNFVLWVGFENNPDPDKLRFIGSSSIPAGLRLGAHWIGYILSVAALELSRLIDLLPDRKSPEVLTVAAKEQVIFIMSLFLARVVMFSPIILAAWCSYKSFILRVVFTILIFMSVYGWARSNPLFSEQIAFVYDFASVGYLALLFVLLGSGRLNGFWASALALIGGQLIFENLGLVVGVAVAVYIWATYDGNPSAGLRQGIRRLIYLGLVSVVTFVTIMALISFTMDTGTSSNSLSLTKYFSESWNVYGKVNFQEIFDIGENILQLMAYPTAGGIILAVLAIFLFKDSEKEISAIRSEYWAAFSICIGFWVTLVPAMFLSGLYYEMGRQLIPLACITTFFVAKGVEYALAKRRKAVVRAS